MLLIYFDCYKIDHKSEEGKSLMEEIILKVALTSKTSFKEISTPKITMKVPFTWGDKAGILENTSILDLVYGYKDGNGKSTAVCYEETGDTNESSLLRDLSDREILTLVFSVNRSKLVGELLDSGDSKIGGFPAKYFLEYVKSGGVEKRTLTYLFVQNGIIHNLKFTCHEL
jgi:hypothetical protein